MLRENGEVNEAIAEAAKRAGARRFVLLSASSTMKWGYGGALEGGTSSRRRTVASPLRRAWGRAAARGTTVARHCSPATSV
jgi:hypothetical protein